MLWYPSDSANVEQPMKEKRQQFTIPDGLLGHYGLGSVKACTPLQGTRNRNFAVRTDEGAWFIRQRYSGYCAPGWIAFDDGVLQFLGERNVPVAVPRAGRDGRTWYRADDAVWQVFPFVSGHTQVEGDAGDAAAVGEALARFHAAGSTFPERYDKLGPRGEACPHEILAMADRLEQEAPACAGPLTHYREWIREAQAALPDECYAALPHTLIHGDPQPANILCEDGRVTALVDADWCAWRPRIYDVAFALLFCCATHDTPIDGESIWSLTQAPRIGPRLVEAFMATYAERCGPLEPAERTALRAQMILSWCGSRIGGALKAPPAERPAFLARAPQTLEELVPESLGI